MPEPHDERSSLPIERAALLWCMRVWVVGLRHPMEAGEKIREMAARLGAPGVADCIEGFMTALAHGATRAIGVNCVCCPSVGEDERALLDSLALAQEARPFEALLLLRRMLTPEGARAALPRAEGIGAALMKAGRLLHAPGAGADRVAAQPWAARPASATLH